MRATDADSVAGAERAIPDRPLRHIACIVDHSDRSWDAADAAIVLCMESGARLSVLYLDRWAGLAVSAHAWVPDLADLQTLLEEWLEGELRRRGLDDAAGVVLGGGAPAAICAWARGARVDLIVVSERRRGRLGRLLSGSFGDRLAAHAPCRVAVVTDAASPRAAGGALLPDPALQAPRP